LTVGHADERKIKADILSDPLLRNARTGLVCWSIAARLPRRQRAIDARRFIATSFVGRNNLIETKWNSSSEWAFFVSAGKAYSYCEERT
jgi:hypothetical protein